MKTTEKEQKDIIKFAKKFFSAKKEPSTVALVSVNPDDGAGAWGCGDIDELVTGIVLLCKQLDEPTRYTVCTQLLETLPVKGMALALEEALEKTGDIRIKKSKIN